MSLADADDSTTLHWAAGYGHVDLTRLLLQYKANPNVVTSGKMNKSTPLEWGVAHMLSHCADLICISALDSDCIEVVEALVKAGACEAEPGVRMH